MCCSNTKPPDGLIWVQHPGRVTRASRSNWHRREMTESQRPSAPTNHHDTQLKRFNCGCWIIEGEIIKTIMLSSSLARPLETNGKASQQWWEDKSDCWTSKQCLKRIIPQHHWMVQPDWSEANSNSDSSLGCKVYINMLDGIRYGSLTTFYTGACKAETPRFNWCLIAS